MLISCTEVYDYNPIGIIFISFWFIRTGHFEMFPVFYGNLLLKEDYFGILATKKKIDDSIQFL